MTIKWNDIPNKTISWIPPSYISEEDKNEFIRVEEARINSGGYIIISHIEYVTDNDTGKKYKVKYSSNNKVILVPIDDKNENQQYTLSNYEDINWNEITKDFYEFEYKLAICKKIGLTKFVSYYEKEVIDRGRKLLKIITEILEYNIEDNLQGGWEEDSGLVVDRTEMLNNFKKALTSKDVGLISSSVSEGLQFEHGGGMLMGDEFDYELLDDLTNGKYNKTWNKEIRRLGMKRIQEKLIKFNNADNINLPDEVRSKEYDAIHYIYNWYTENNIDKLSWKEFQQKFQQFANKYNKLLTEIRKNKPIITKDDLEEWIFNYAPDNDKYNVDYTNYKPQYETDYTRKDKNLDVGQLVMRINRGAKIDNLIPEEMWKFLNAIMSSSIQSNHPTKMETVGWVRMDLVDKDNLLVEEVQTDIFNGLNLAIKMINMSYDEWLANLDSMSEEQLDSAIDKMDADTEIEHARYAMGDWVGDELEKRKDKIKDKIEDLQKKKKWFILRRDRVKELKKKVRGLGGKQRYDSSKQFMKYNGWTEEKLNQAKEEAKKIFTDWSEYALSTTLQYARENNIKNVILHTGKTLNMRDPAVQEDKITMYYDNLAKSFNFKKQQINLEGVSGEFWVRKASKNKMYYNSHGRSMFFSEFIELEVEERENYDIDEVKKWMKKYKINKNTECIWITDDKKQAHRYNLDAEQWNNYDNYKDDEIFVNEINPKDGFIIPESDDGDNGFLFIYTNPNWYIKSIQNKLGKFVIAGKIEYLKPLFIEKLSDGSEEDNQKYSELFDTINNLDNSDYKNYTQWLINMYVNKKLPEQDFEKIGQYLDKFENNKNNLEAPYNNINNYKDLNTFYNTLDNINENQVAKEDEIVQKIRDGGAYFIPNIIVGLPEETEQTYQNTANFLKDNQDIISHFNATNLAVYGGTEMADMLKDKVDLEEEQNQREVLKSYGDEEGNKVALKFTNDLYNFGIKLLDKKPITKESLLKIRSKLEKFNLFKISEKLLKYITAGRVEFLREQFLNKVRKALRNNCLLTIQRQFPELTGEELDKKVEQAYIRNEERTLEPVTKSFETLVEIDQTPSKQYLGWIIRLYWGIPLPDNKITPRLLPEDYQKVRESLDAFYKYSIANKIPKEKRDINLYKTLQELDAVLEPFRYTSEAGIRMTHEEKEILDRDAEKIYSGNGWSIYVPHSHKCAWILGKDTRWCTAYDSPMNYNSYCSRGDLIILVNETNSRERYQFHYEDGLFNDINDKNLYISHFKEKFPDLMEVIAVYLHNRFKKDLSEGEPDYKYVGQILMTTSDVKKINDMFKLLPSNELFKRSEELDLYSILKNNDLKNNKNLQKKFYEYNGALEFSIVYLAKKLNLIDASKANSMVGVYDKNIIFTDKGVGYKFTDGWEDDDLYDTFVEKDNIETYKDIVGGQDTPSWMWDVGDHISFAEVWNRVGDQSLKLIKDKIASMKVTIANDYDEIKAGKKLTKQFLNKLDDDTLKEIIEDEMDELANAIQYAGQECYRQSYEMQMYKDLKKRIISETGELEEISTKREYIQTIDGNKKKVEFDGTGLLLNLGNYMSVLMEYYDADSENPYTGEGILNILQEADIDKASINDRDDWYGEIDDNSMIEILDDRLSEV